jgi:MarR family 2-MHQ and catechol resistance regulon transcriptional repressor
MPKERYLKTLRALAECYQAFSRHDAAHARSLGYTSAQFDIIATLGNTDGMTFKELGEKTLITKGTLTGVVDRLEARGVVRRVGSPSDARSTIVQLTPKGRREFERVFHAHVANLKRGFQVLDPAELDRLDYLLGRLREGFR